MNLEITEKVVIEIPENPKSKYVLTVEFNDDCDDLELEFETAEEALEYQKVYKEYKKRLDADWNEWCNLEDYQAKELFAEVWGIDEDEDKLDEFEENFEIYEFWHSSDEYPDYLAMADSTIITWFDEIGVEYHIKEVN